MCTNWLHNTKTDERKLEQTNVLIFFWEISPKRFLKALRKPEEPPCFCRNKRQKTSENFYFQTRVYIRDNWFKAAFIQLITCFDVCISCSNTFFV